MSNFLTIIIITICAPDSQDNVGDVKLRKANK